MAKKGYSTAVHNQPYRFYNKKTHDEFKDKLGEDNVTFQDFITGAIEDYLNGNYHTKKEGETD